MVCGTKTLLVAASDGLRAFGCALLRARCAHINAARSYRCIALYARTARGFCALARVWFVWFARTRTRGSSHARLWTRADLWLRIVISRHSCGLHCLVYRRSVYAFAVAHVRCRGRVHARFAHTRTPHTRTRAHLRCGCARLARTMPFTLTRATLPSLVTLADTALVCARGSAVCSSALFGLSTRLRCILDCRAQLDASFRFALHALHMVASSLPLFLAQEATNGPKQNPAKQTDKTKPSQTNPRTLASFSELALFARSRSRVSDSNSSITKYGSWFLFALNSFAFSFRFLYPKPVNQWTKLNRTTTG